MDDSSMWTNVEKIIIVARGEQSHVHGLPGGLEEGKHLYRSQLQMAGEQIVRSFGNKNELSCDSVGCQFSASAF
jgi:hypothetical protein